MIGSLMLLLFYVKTDDSDLKLVALFCLFRAQFDKSLSLDQLYINNMYMCFCHLSVMYMHYKY